MSEADAQNLMFWYLDFVCVYLILAWSQKFFIMAMSWVSVHQFKHA